MKKIVLLSVYCLLSVVAIAQTFKGKVTDTNGKPIPYASLYLKELSSGFTTDDNGCFQTTLKSGNYTCEVSSIGFTPETLRLRISAKGLEQNIVLLERIYELSGVEVTKGTEDPAYAVMRKTIANAPYYRVQVKSYTAGTYLKGTGKMKEIPAILKLSKEVRKESKEVLGKLFVLEQQCEVHFVAPNTWDNRVKAYSNSFPESMKLDLGMMMINFYDPVIFGKISPLCAGAFSYYRFQLDGCYSEGNHLVNKVRVIPKKNNPKLLSGYIYIIEDLWCISAADLSLNTGGVKASIRVTCKEVMPSVFLATSTNMECKINMMGVKAEASYLAAAHYVKVEVNKKPFDRSAKQAETATTTGSVRTLSKKQQKVREKIEELSSKEDLTMAEAYKLSKLVTRSIEEADTLRPKHKFERRVLSDQTTIKTDSLADKKDSLYWANVRSVPLRPEELESYIRKAKLSVPKDSLRKVAGKGSIRIDSDQSVITTILFGDTYRTKNKKSWLELYGLRSYVPEYNFVDGLWVGAKFTVGRKLSDATSLWFTPSAYYTTARKSVVGSGSMTLSYAPRRMGKLLLSGGVLSADYNGESGESRLVNSFASLLFARNDVKLYDKRFLTVNNDIELANGLLFSASLSWQQRKELENTVYHSLFRKEAKSNTPRTDGFFPMPKNELLKSSFALQYTPAHYYRMIKGKKVYDAPRYPTFTLGYERAFPLSGAIPSSSYHRMELSIHQKVEFGMFNTLLWSVNSGAFWDVNRIQFPDYKHFAATRFPVTERTFDSGFVLLDNYAYSTATRWAQAGITWRTPYLLLKHLPFLQRKSFGEALHLRSLVVYGHQPYTEVGYSVGLANLARLGVFAGFDSLEFRSVGVSVSIPLTF